jgi:hypothetical protein
MLKLLDILRWARQNDPIVFHVLAMVGMAVWFLGQGVSPVHSLSHPQAYRALQGVFRWMSIR